MKPEQVIRLEKLLQRELSADEKDRLDRIRQVLEIDDNDGIWDVLTAMEYQRSYYDELPRKIALASEEMLKGVSEAAEKETAKAQSLLVENLTEQVRKLSIQINMSTLLPTALLALLCLLLYGSLLLWAGFCTGSGQAQPVSFILRMPSGILMGVSALIGGMWTGVHAAREFAEGGAAWRQKMLTSLALLVAGGALVGLGV